MLMGRKRINQSVQYCVTGIGYCVGGQIDAARIQAHKAGKLRSDIWNEFGSLKAWGMKADALYKAFQVKHPPSDYGLDFKQWQQTFNRVIDDIHATQEAAKSWVIRKIYRTFSKDGFRSELVKSLNTLEWMDYPLIHRWMRSAMGRGHSWVNNQICIGTGNGAKVSRVSRNVVAIEFCGAPINQRRYEKIRLLFKVGRVTPKGNLRIIFRSETGAVELHYPRLGGRVEPVGVGAIGLDKGFTEAFTDSKGDVYGDGIGKVMNRATAKRHKRGQARNRLWQLAQKKPHIHRCNLGRKRWTEFESRKKRQLTVMVRAGVNQIFNRYSTAIVEDLSTQIKSKKQAPSRNRKLSEWCKGTLQTALLEISHRRQSSVMVVNAAYTSQMDSRNGTLLGFRNGDSFFTFDGVVIGADCNAARNIEARFDDPEITCYMKHSDVRQVLIHRTASFLAAMGLTLQQAVYLNLLDPKHLRGEKARLGKGKSRSQVA
jgi:hypothetical protein